MKRCGLHTFSCKKCGAQKQIKMSEKKRGGGVYCSKSCMVAAKKPPLQPAGLCMNCGSGFSPDPRGRPKFFCSRKCIGIYVGKKSYVRGKLNHYTCEECKKEFSTYHKNRKFCSRECSSIGRKKSYVIDGKSFGGRKDANHDEIVDALLAAGCAIIDTHKMGGGFPDLLVWYNGVIVLMEIKNLKTAYGRKGLSPRQSIFKQSWPGKIHIVNNVAEALRAAGIEGEK